LGGSYFISKFDDADAGLPDSPIGLLKFVGRMFWKVPFMPIILLLLGLLFLQHKLLGFALIVGAALSVLVAGCLIAGLMHFIGNRTNVLDWLGGAINTLLMKILPARKASSDEDQFWYQFWYLKKEEMDVLVCNNDPKPLTLKQLPLLESVL
jgi:hypothetical protein